MQPEVYASSQREETGQKVIGTCQNLEKEYLRVQGQVRPELIRPQSVLEKSLGFVLGQYADGKDYCYIQNQCRSIRQDLLLQGIKNDFTIRVVQENIRVALLNQDLKEYEKLRLELHELYVQLPQHANEEIILCSIVYLILKEDYQSELTKLTEMQESELVLASVLFAQKVLNSLSQGNYALFFRLLKQIKGVSRNVIDIFKLKWQLRCLQLITKAFKSNEIEPHLVQSVFALEDQREYNRFIKETNGVLGSNGKFLIKETLSNHDESAL